MCRFSSHRSSALFLSLTMDSQKCHKTKPHHLTLGMSQFHTYPGKRSGWRRQRTAGATDVNLKTPLTLMKSRAKILLNDSSLDDFPISRLFDPTFHLWAMQSTWQSVSPSCFLHIDGIRLTGESVYNPSSFWRDIHLISVNIFWQPCHNALLRKRTY
jgi:hypothetical protein